ncbi:glycosyltransferase family 2 protein [Hymenobacter rubidus]|uniref:glycosyltransferase family 2 protein n=1 Tax=Hymenobacter rubidus TaxID=1441626 RepID=UPI00191EEE6C|nr:glycosyltransferase family A protein [Hymenobacter rubidus]
MSVKSVKVSVVIPCYNSGEYLGDALSSVAKSEGGIHYEVIIVDDGSTDIKTKEFLRQLPSNKYTIVYQKNTGPAGARNRGIKEAAGEYILFLDSDNKIRASYIARAVDLFEKYPSIGVVYGNASFFGDSNAPRFKSKPFDLIRMLENNYIDMCSMVRRQVCEEVGGMDEARILIGHEDWDFWLRINELKWQFYFIDEVLFDYRIRTDSLVMQAVMADKYENMLQYFYSKHWRILLREYKYLVEQNAYYVFDRRNPFRSFLKYIKNNTISKE